MQQLELHALDVLAVQVPHRAQHLFHIFAGKAQDCMDNYVNVQQTQAGYGLLKYRKIISSADEAGCIRMDRLEA